MSIPTVCQQCSTSYRLRDDFAGKKVRCRKCGATIAVPAADEAAPVKADEPVAQVATVKAREAATVSAPVVSARQVAPVEASEPVADISPVAEAPQIAAESEGAAENPMDFLAAIAAARPVAATASVQPTASAEPVTVANPTPQVAAAAVQEESPVAVTAAATTGAVAAAEIPQAAGAPDPLELLPVVRPVSPVGADPAAKVQAPVKAEPVAGAPAAAKPAGMSKGVKVLLFVLLGIFVFLFLGAAAIGVAAGYWYSHLGPGIALDVKVTGSADDAGSAEEAGGERHQEFEGRRLDGAERGQVQVDD